VPLPKYIAFKASPGVKTKEMIKKVNLVKMLFIENLFFIQE
jgi:hypothetical protein